MKDTLRLNNKETLAYQYYFHKENKETLLLIHGNMSSGVHFSPIIERLRDDYNVLVPDLRGFGDSTYHRSIEKLGDFANDLMDLLDQLSIKRTHVIGWSTGGGVALKMAAKFPSHIGRIVLLESCSYRGYPIYQKDDNMQPTNKLYTTKENMAKDPLQVVPALKAMKSNDRETMASIWQAAIYNVKTPEESDFDMYLTETLKQRNLVDVDWALMTFNMSKTPNGVAPGDGSIEDITHKTLSIYGLNDLVITRAMYEETLTALKNARGHIYDDGSHSPITDRPCELSSQILAFLKE